MSVDDEKRYGHDYLLLTSISPLLVKEVTISHANQVTLLSNTAPPWPHGHNRGLPYLLIRTPRGANAPRGFG